MPIETLRWPQHPKDAHVRTCQECGHTQVMKDPGTQQSDNWREAKCRRCKSEGSLDYGSTNYDEDDDLSEQEVLEGLRTLAEREMKSDQG